MLFLLFGWGIGIRTPTNRVRVCRATVTPFPNAGDSDNKHIVCLRDDIIHISSKKVNNFFQKKFLYIKSFLNELVAKIKQAYEGLKPDSTEGQIVAEMVDATERLHELFVEALMDATENYQSAESADKNPTSNLDVRYCDRDNTPNSFNTEGKTLTEQLNEAYEAAESFDQRYVYVGRFSNAFRELLKGKNVIVNDYPIAMNYRDAYLSMHSKDTGKYHGDGINYHDLGVNGLESALTSFESPKAIMMSKRQGKIELVLQGVDKKGKSLLSIVAINTKTQNNRKFLDAHIVTSVYGRKSIEKYISNAENEGRLLLTKKEETSQGIPQVQYEGNINEISSNYSISDSTAKSQGKFSDRDADYMTAVESGDTETAQRMVDEAAKNAGYNSPMLYHGTQSFGFTEFDLSRMDDKRSIFLTSNNKIASTYSGVGGTRKVSASYNKDIDGMKLEKVTDELNALSDEYYKGALDYRKYTYIDTKYSNELISTVNDGIDALQKNVSSIVNQYKDDGKIYQQLFALNNKLKRYEYQNLSTPIYMLLHHTDVFAENGKEIAELEKNIRLLNEIRFLDVSEGYVVRDMLDGYSLDLLDETEARNELKYLSSKGNYSMYAKSENPLVIDGKGQLWRDIRNWHESVYYQKENTEVGENDEFYYLIDKRTGEELEDGGIMKNVFSQGMTKAELHNFMLNKANQMLRIQTEGIYTTREIAKFAKERGYDSVVFKNILDNGGMNSDVEMNETADIYVYFSPNQIKSADSVIYDDNGNVIPLSKRFDPTNDDIRYSERGKRKTVSNYNVDEHPLDRYNRIKITKTEQWRIHDALTQRYNNSTEFPLYVFVSIFNTKLNIDNQYCVRWLSFGEFEVISKGGKKLDTIRRLYDEYHKRGQDDVLDGRNGKREYIRRRYSRDAFNVGDRSDDRRNAPIYNKHAKSDGRKGGQSTNHSDKNSGEKLSDRDPDAITPRSLLANALEGTVQNDIERKKLDEYKKKIELMNAENIY